MPQDETKDSTSASEAAPTPTTDTPASAAAPISDAVVPATKEVKETGERKARVVVEYIGGEETDEELEEGGEDAGDPSTEDLLAMYPDDTEVRTPILSSLSFPGFPCAI